MKYCLLCLSLILSLKSSIADAIDLQPNDARPPPAGINSIQVAYQHFERGDLYSQGNKIATDSKISSDLYLWRLGHSFQISNQPAYFYVQTPVGAVHPQRALSVASGDSGVGDTTLLLAFGRMLIAKPKLTSL